MSIQPGTYVAKVVSHAISETKGGDPQAAITFGFDGHTLTYFGSFKPGALKFTIQALLACGLKGQNPAGALEIGKEVSIVVADEVGQDGVSRTKIKWVNKLGGVKNVIAEDAARAKLSALEGAVMAAREEQGVQDEIPF